MRAFTILGIFLGTACSVPTWGEGAELVLRERSKDTIGVIWDDAEGAASYVATIDGEHAQEISAPNVEVRFEGLEEARLYLIEVRARNVTGGESEPLRLQVRTRDGTPPVFPEGAQLRYELTNAARFWWPEATDAAGVVGYVLRDVDHPEAELEYVPRGTEVVYDQPPPRRVELVALDAASNESEPLRVELSEEELASFGQRRLEFHQRVAEEIELDDIANGRVPEGIDGALLRDLIGDRFGPNL